ncbi:hypothetical protein P280DRAFT_152140 [Massarina eburnea CBS 473.64]|uniref:Uncharacterized protein n=1 Tax=Massarina eburnea CBS 473.64 TaxID=1395130 RepID=A0A6A6RPG5_9PLEO|nr:hypothetical protein P280DRAFT_152140 [Massarina eburnea CBS 473.64]
MTTDAMITSRPGVGRRVERQITPSRRLVLYHTTLNILRLKPSLSGYFDMSTGPAAAGQLCFQKHLRGHVADPAVDVVMHESCCNMGILHCLQIRPCLTFDEACRDRGIKRNVPEWPSVSAMLTAVPYACRELPRKTSYLQMHGTTTDRLGWYCWYYADLDNMRLRVWWHRTRTLVEFVFSGKRLRGKLPGQKKE